VTELFLVRHAVAVERAEGQSDAGRWLTEAGEASFREGVEGLANLGIRFDRIVHSPLRRAYETAELLVPLLDGSTQVDPGLARRAGVATFATLTVPARTAVVGHEPWLGQLTALLVVGKASAARRFPFEKGGVTWLRGAVALGGMDVVAVLPPDVLSSARG
jgi:phosphohistidine phosphatase